MRPITAKPGKTNPKGQEIRPITNVEKIKAIIQMKREVKHNKYRGDNIDRFSPYSSAASFKPVHIFVSVINGILNIRN